MNITRNERRLMLKKRKAAGEADIEEGPDLLREQAQLGTKLTGISNLKQRALLWEVSATI
jgi:hypothetical protein